MKIVQEKRAIEEIAHLLISVSVACGLAMVLSMGEVLHALCLHVR